MRLNAWVVCGIKHALIVYFCIYPFIYVELATLVELQWMSPLEFDQVCRYDLLWTAPQVLIPQDSVLAMSNRIAIEFKWRFVRVPGVSCAPPCLGPAGLLSGCV